MNTAPATPLFGYSPPQVAAGIGPAGIGDTTYRLVYSPQPAGQFDAFGDASVSYCPEPWRAEVDRVIDAIYEPINNGVYRAGFATAQEKYEEAVRELFRTLDWLEKRLRGRRWLCGTSFTEADVRLFTTLVRFDAVYYSHFKCNLRRLVDYPNLWRYARRVYALPGVAKTVDMAQIKEHYYRSMKSINPTQIVPKGPLLDFSLR